MNDDQIQEQIKKITLERINAMPDDLRLSVGAQDFNKKDLFKHINAADEIGREIMETQLEFLRALASGAVYQNE